MKFPTNLTLKRLMTRMAIGVGLLTVAPLALAITAPQELLLFATSAAQFGMEVFNFKGLQFAVAQGSLGSPSGTMSGYAAGDTITLQCAGVTFSSSPVVGVGAVTTGSVAGSNLIYGGVTNGPVPNGTATCSQASTSGSGTGYQVSLSFGLIASAISVAALNTGGGPNNGSLAINAGDTGNGNAVGGENTLFGDKAGFGLTGLSQYNTAMGHNALGSGAGAPAVSANNVAFGTDAARNFTGSAFNGSITAIGSGAARNAAGGWITAIGSGAFGSNGTNTNGALSGYNMTGVGYFAGSSCTSCSGSTLIGAKAGDALTTGTNDVIIQATLGGDNCSNGATESNVFAVCAGAGRILTITGAGTPSTSQATLAGSVGTGGFTIASLPTCNSGLAGQFAYVTNGVAAPSYMGAVSTTGSANDPVFCNGSGWVYH